MVDEVPEIGDDFLTQVLRGAKDSKVEIEMLEETCQDALRLAAEAGWDEGDALLGVFASGVAYLRSQLTQPRPMDGQASRVATAEQLAQRCMQLESMYAVLKFRAYGMARDRRILELNVAGLRPDNEGMRHRIRQYQEQVEGLTVDIQRLQEENRKLRQALDQDSEIEQPPAQDEWKRRSTFWERAACLLRVHRRHQP